MPTTKNLYRATAITLSGLVLLGTAGASANAAVPAGAGHTEQVRRSTVSPKAYYKGSMSIGLTITNDTSSDWTMDGPFTQVQGGNWAARPDTVLPAGASETITCYTWSPVDLDLAVGYTMANGDVVASEINVPSVGPNVWNPVGFYTSVSDSGVLGPQDPAFTYSASEIALTGWHINPTLSVSAAG